MKQVQKPKKPIIFYYVVALIVILLLNLLLFPRLLEPKVTEVDYGKFLQMVDNNEISEVQIQSNEIIFSDKSSPANYYKTGVMNDYKLVDRLYEAGITEFGTPIIEQMSPLMEFLLTWVIPIVVMVALGQWLMKRMTSKMMGGMGNAMSFGKSNAKVYVQSETGIKFADVAGEDEAKEILQEIVDFLHNPKKYEEIGAKMPKGALLVGPPGTGKTLLAKAVAGEANVPFFSISGSEFVEMFVGMGAAKVRDLFQQANEKAPCIVFIDEIDTVGKKRDGGGFSGNDEREQTLNQLLAEMDGFDGKKGVVILAATNRPDSLDPALLRPGRFDRRVPVELPDLKGREEILKVHAKNIRVGDNVDYNAIARMASGASGAELANMINEAAINAVKKGRKPGIYMSWDACKAQVMGFPNARYKGFKTKAEAEAFLNPDANELMQIDEDTLVAYVDGSYDHSQKRFSYGMVLMHDGVERYFAYPYADEELATMRNVAGEIKGSEAAMRFAKENGYKKLAIHYDYEGIQKWCTGEWAAKKEGTQAYQRIYEEMKQYVQIKFVKVKGHSNDKYNDYADMLAKSALGIGDGSFEKKEDQEWIKVR